MATILAILACYCAPALAVFVAFVLRSGAVLELPSEPEHATRLIPASAQLAILAAARYPAARHARLIAAAVPAPAPAPALPAIPAIDPGLLLAWQARRIVAAFV